jgi:phosphatidylglycerol:prolipoprotein diacylglycerol transferase
MNFFVHDINPIILKVGPINIAWYGLCYLVSFLLGYIFVRKNFAKKGTTIPAEHYDSFIFYIIFGVIIGGRIGYIIFYQLSYYLQNPLHVFYVWQGGMSFHGGLLGVIIAGLIFCKRYKYKFYTLADPAMPLVAIGVGLVRVGNFINGELYGSQTNIPWAVIFQNTDPLAVPRHPSQLYEALLEGFLMAILLQFLLTRTKVKGLIFWLFIGIYGLVRYLVEYIRVPDDIDLYRHGMLFGYFSMGQLLSLIMLIVATIFIIKVAKNRQQT